jgi:hypothetical protein
VDFLIDGKVIWIENNPPYVFGGDDNGTNLGYLITTWLTPGSHVFTIHAVSFNGHQVSDSFTAKVTAAPEPPAALKGTWERMVTAADFNLPGIVGGGPAPVGRWEMVFDRVAAWELDPGGSGLGNQYSVQGNLIHVYAPIQETPDNGPSGGFSRYGHNHIGGLDCYWSGPFGTYKWSVSGSTLKLTPVHEGCPNRQGVWAGVWTLKSPNPPPV